MEFAIKDGDGFRNVLPDSSFGKGTIRPSKMNGEQLKKNGIFKVVREPAPNQTGAINIRPKIENDGETLTYKWDFDIDKEVVRIHKLSVELYTLDPVSFNIDQLKASQKREYVERSYSRCLAGKSHAFLMLGVEECDQYEKYIDWVYDTFTLYGLKKAGMNLDVPFDERPDFPEEY